MNLVKNMETVFHPIRYHPGEIYIYQVQYQYKIPPWHTGSTPFQAKIANPQSKVRKSSLLLTDNQEGSTNNE